METSNSPPPTHARHLQLHATPSLSNAMQSHSQHCSCGLLPCICVLAGDDDVLAADVAVSLPQAPSSRLRSLVAANATTQCMSCMFLPCICPTEDELYGEDETTSVEAASPVGADELLEPEAPEEQDAIGRVRLARTHTQSEIEPQEDELWIAREIKRHLRPHQVEGVRFMYSHAVANQGCILADYMGLGKTLQVIAVIYSYMTDRLVAMEESPSDKEEEESEERATSTTTMPPSTMVLCPAICIPNWQSEFKKWLSAESLARIPVFAFDATAGKGSTTSRIRMLQKWKREGGVLLMGYEMYRSLLNPTLGSASLDRETNIQVCSRVSSATMEVTNAASTKLQKNAREFYRLLCGPGADLVVLDEGHRLKDPTSLLCQSVAKIESKRRLVLTGYPVQNSLSEYWCMVNFARDNFLGTYDAFRSRYERPIVEGNRERSKELVHKLKGVVLRRGKALLKKQLPPKREWILYCNLSPLQHQLYNDFLNFYGGEHSGRATADLLTAYSALLQVMNHPDIIQQKLSPDENAVLDDDDVDLSPGAGTAEDEDLGWGWESEEKMLERRQQVAEQTRKRRQKILDRQKSYEWARKTILGEGDSDALSINGGSRRRKLPRSSALTETSSEEVSAYETMVLENSGKMAVLMAIIEESFAVGDKVVVFSQSVPTLKVITDFLLACDFNPARVDGSEPKRKTKPPAGRRKALPSRRDPAGLLRKKVPTGPTRGKAGASGGETAAYGEWFLQIDGSTPGAKRMEYIQAFSSATSAVKLLLVSTRAGAEGINLHAANRLVLFDVSWNPSNDHQSMCRSHRIGQAKDVHVYRLVSTGTMERMIYEQQMKKVDLSTNVVDDKQQQQQADGDVESMDSSAALSGFLRPPAESTKALSVDRSLFQDDEVLVKCVDKSGHWLADILPAHEYDDEEEEEAEAEAEAEAK